MRRAVRSVGPSGGWAAVARIVPCGAGWTVGPERGPGRVRRDRPAGRPGCRWPGRGPSREWADRRGGSAVGLRRWRHPGDPDNSARAPRDGGRRVAMPPRTPGRPPPGRHRGDLNRARATGLNEVGLMSKIDRFSSVSGGSITAAVLAANWSKLEFDPGGVASNFVDAVVAPLRAMAGTDVDMAAIISGMLLPAKSISDRVAAAYRKHLFGDTTLQDLPDQPRFVFNATNLESGVLFRFSKPYLADYRVGQVLKPRLALASAVAASSAFPPVLSPCTLDLAGQTWTTNKGNDLTSAGYRSKIKLSDGGVYDNLGVETAWKLYKTILVSDAGGHVADEPDPASDWVRQTTTGAFAHRQPGPVAAQAAGDRLVDGEEKNRHVRRNPQLRRRLPGVGAQSKTRGDAASRRIADTACRNRGDSAGTAHQLGLCHLRRGAAVARPGRQPARCPGQCAALPAKPIGVTETGPPISGPPQLCAESLQRLALSIQA